MNEEKIYIKTHILKQDYRAVVYFNIFFKNRVFTVIIIAGAIVAMVTLLQRLLGSPISDFMYYISVLIIVCMIVLLVTTEILIRRFVSSDKLSIGANIEIIIDSEKIVCKTSAKSNSEISLDKLYRVYETNKYFFIFINPEEAIISKKEDMNEEGINKLRSILKQNNILK